MGSEVQHHLLLTLPEHHRVCERRHTRADFDGSAASVVEHAVFEGPAVDVPYPAGNGAIDECGPEEDENECWDETSSFGDGAHDNGSCDSAELKL